MITDNMIQTDYQQAKNWITSYLAGSSSDRRIGEELEQQSMFRALLMWAKSVRGLKKSEEE